MKNYLAGLATAIVLTAVLHACTGSNTVQPVVKGNICSNYLSAPVNEMDKDFVLNMIRNYYQMQYQAINADPRMSFPANAPMDSRAVFFSLDTLKRLIYNIERASSGFPADMQQNLGVNVYFASYPARAKMSKNGYDYTNRHTLVFIPSIFDGRKNRARDFDMISALRTDKPAGEPRFLDSSFLRNPQVTRIGGMYFRVQTLTSSSTTTSSTDIGAQNHGTAIPPPPSGSTILDETDPN